MRSSIDAHNFFHPAVVKASSSTFAYYFPSLKMVQLRLPLAFFSLCYPAVHAAWPEFGRPREGLLGGSAPHLWTRKRMMRGWEQQDAGTPLTTTQQQQDEESRKDPLLQEYQRADVAERFLQDSLEEVLDDESDEYFLELSLSLSISYNNAGGSIEEDEDSVSTGTPSTPTTAPSTLTISVPTFGTTSPSNPTVGTSSPGTPSVGTSTPNIPTVGTSSPSSSTIGTSSPSSPTVGTSSPSSSTFSVPPTASPTTMFGSAIPSDLPSLAPTGISNAPSSSLPLTTVPPTSMLDDNSTEAPTTATNGVVVRPVFECGDNGLSLGLATDVDVTEIFLTVGYRAESTFNSTEVFEEELERLLLETAVSAALGGCDDDGDAGDDDGINNTTLRARHYRQLMESSSAEDFEWPTTRRQRQLLMVESLNVGPCEGTLNETDSCTIMETAMLFYLRGAVDPDVAAYASYLAIEEHMEQDLYIGIVPTVVLLEYLSPLPLVPPPGFSGNNNNGTDSSSGGAGGLGGSAEDPAVLQSTAAADRLSVSPWTIGACVATIMGGVISFLVYNRNRGQRRLMQLNQDRHNHQSTNSLERRARNPVAI